MTSEENNRKWELLASEIRNLSPHVHPPVPNPAPLGLLGFGLTTGLLQMKHTRLNGSTDEDMDGVDVVVLGFSMFFGGLLQLLAGLGEVKRNNIFGYTAFILYGAFWMSFALIEIIQIMGPAETTPGVNPKTIQTMLSLVGLYTAILFITTFKMNMTISLLFFLLMVTLFLLAGGVDNDTVDIVGGYFGLATGAVAYWLAGAELVNDIYGGGEEIVPLGHWSGNLFKRHGGSHIPGRIHGVMQDEALHKSRFGPLARFSRRQKKLSEHTPEDIEAPPAEQSPE